jgi:putative transposase
MQIGNRFRCYPTPAQAKTLLAWIGCQHFIYNAKVREDRYFRCFARKSLAHTGQFAPIDQQYSHFKTDLTPWLEQVPSQILRNGAVLWKQAYARYFAKLGGRPVIHRKNGEQSVWITSELLTFKPVVNSATGEITSYTLHIGTKKFPLGTLNFAAHRNFKPAASIHISVKARRWHVSFNYDDGVPEPSEQDTIEYLMQFSQNELRASTMGLDRGVNLPLAGSDGQRFGFTTIQHKRLEAQERHKRRWQRRQARRTKGSKNWVKAKHKVAHYQHYGADVRRDVAHKTSHALAQDDRYKLFVFEALKIKNMTKRPKSKQDENGRWVKNGAAAKSGLNKAILDSTWGKTRQYLGYKARRKGKLVIEVPAFYSSQECAVCGHTHSDNRPAQARFVCQRCAHTDHADHNAAVVIAQRGVRLLLSGVCVPKKSKKCRITKHKVGVEASEPGSAMSMSPTPGKIKVRRAGARTVALRSVNQETHATTLSV